MAVRLFLADLNRADDDGRSWDELSNEEREEHQKLARRLMV